LPAEPFVDAAAAAAPERRDVPDGQRCGYPRRVQKPPRLACLLALSLLPLLTAQEEQQPQDTFGHSRHGGEFDDGPRQAARLMPGMSPQVHFPVRGLDEESQRLFDQGICQQHGFWYFEAERSFREVARRHPDCALAYVGMCIANVDNHRRAAGFAAQAVQREAGAPANERLWIDAWARFHQIQDGERQALQSSDAAKIEAAKKAIVERSQNRDEKQLGRDLVRDLEAIAAGAPDDAEAKAFLIVQIWRNSQAGIEISSHGAVDALLDQLFAQAPLHPAHHFRIHLWDHERPERALQSAALIGSSAPGIAHQWHMGGHIFDRLGRFADAAWQQEAAARVDHAAMATDRVLPYEIHNYGHNQEWLCRSLSAVGRVHDAVDLAQNMLELPRHPQKNRVEAAESIAGFGRLRLLETLESYECWDELMRACTDGHVEPTDDAGDQLRRLQALGTAHWRRGDAEAGARVLADVEALRERLRGERHRAVDAAEDQALARRAGDGEVDAAVADAAKRNTEPLRRCEHVLHQLRGEQALQRGDGKAASAEFEQAPDTPPWPRALARLQAGERDAAVDLLRPAVGKHARVPALARLVFAVSAAGKQEELRARFDELRRLAGGADLDAPLLQRLQPIASALGAPADWRLPQPPGDDVGRRVPLDSLGPFRWQPQQAPAFDVALCDGGRLTPESCRGRPTLLVCYLGSGCAHCVEQLRALLPKVDAFAAAGIDVAAIGTEPLARAQALQQQEASAQRGLRFAADPELAAFRAFRAHDDFESMPLHATLLLDAEGRIRWQDVSAEPFRDFDWLLGESRRLLAVPSASVRPHAGG
jgi:peroxiredoxin